MLDVSDFGTATFFETEESASEALQQWIASREERQRVSSLKEYDKQHIFPNEFLRRNGVVKKKINCIINICLLVAQENQKIGGSAPTVKYLEPFIDKRFFPTVMKSHYIP